MLSSELISFGMEPVTPSIIMVAGVGGGGSNAVNHMYELGIAQVTFMICNTDKQALGRSPVPIKMKLGENLTEGLGAGNNPERGRAAAIESLDEIVSVFKREGIKMVFITAGMGGGTGTGAAPVIAKAARELGILTVGIVTLPFKAEGKVRALHAMEGIEELRKHVDALLVVNNENIQEIYGKLPITEAFGKADDILATAAKGIAEIITRDGVVNVDFADVSTVMRGSGIALMGSGRASGEDRAKQVADLSLSSPLLNHNNINGARNILINISWGDEEIMMEEMYGIVGYIQEQAGNGANIIWGAGKEPSLGKDIEVTIIATGFNMDETAVWGVVRTGSGANAIPGAGMPKPAFDPSKPFTAGPAAEFDASLPGVSATEPRKRWQPPVEGQNPPVRPAGSGNPFQRNASPSAAPKPCGPKEEAPEAASPFKGIPSPNRVIRVQESEIYSNLKDISEVPAFMRRKVKFVVDGATPAGKGSSRAVIREEPAAEKTPVEGSLFD